MTIILCLKIPIMENVGCVRCKNNPDEIKENEMKRYNPPKFTNQAMRESKNGRFIEPEDFKELQNKYTDLQNNYTELIMAVGNKYPGETRHETALKYIRQAEKPGRQSSENNAQNQPG